jgi:hypothetical protein
MLKFKNQAFFVCLIFFGLCSKTSSAQNNYQEGYVVKNRNDTLFGKISDRKEGGFGGSGIHEKIRFKGKGLKKRFSAKKIRAYKIGETTVRSLYLDGEMNFLKVASEGYVNHYIFEFQEQGEQLIQDIDYFQKGENAPLLRANQGLLGLKRKRLAAFFNDCPPLVEKIRNKDFKYAFEVADFYNNWKSGR